MICNNTRFIKDVLLEGQPLESQVIIDCHAHLGCWNNFRIPKFDEYSLIESMDLLGINKMCISALAGIGPDFIYGNNWVEEVVKKKPNRFFGYIVINPNYPELIDKELEKHWKKGIMSAVKIHPETHDCSLEGKEYFKLYEFLEKKNGLLLSHVWGINAVKNFGKIAAIFPNVTFIMGHSGGEPKAIYEAIEVANKNKNVYLDLTGSAHYQGIVELMVRQVGADRILFGTDAPFLDARPAVGRIGYAEIPEEDKYKILGLNMENILRVCT